MRGGQGTPAACCKQLGPQLTLLLMAEGEAVTAVLSVPVSCLRFLAVLWCCCCTGTRPVEPGLWCPVETRCSDSGASRRSFLLAGGEVREAEASSNKRLDRVTVMAFSLLTGRTDNYDVQETFEGADARNAGPLQRIHDSSGLVKGAESRIAYLTSCSEHAGYVMCLLTFDGS
jgi:hypothetical protein